MLVHLSVPASQTPGTALKHGADALWLDGDPAAAGDSCKPHGTAERR